MTQILILLFFIILLSALALMIHGGEILTPSFGLCAGFFFSVIAAGMNIKRWNLNLHWNTIAVITSALFVFIFVDFFISIIASVQEHRILGRAWREVVAEKRKEIRIQPLDYEKTMILLLIAFVVFHSILYLRSVVLVVQHSGRVVNSWTEMAHAFRALTSYYQGDEDVPFLIEQIHSMISYLGYVCAYLIVYQLYFFKKVDKALCLLFTIVLARSVINSSRFTILRLLIVLVICYDIFQYWDTGKGLRFKLSTIMKFMGAIVFFFAVFVFLKSIVGRIDNRSPVYYITFYLGGSIHNLDEFLQEYHSKPELWGKETFRNFYHSLYMITKNPHFNYMIHKEFIFKNGESTGNVYTAFREYFHDFGYPGIYILTALSSLIINAFYYQLRSNIWKTAKIGYRISALFYAHMYGNVFLSFFADQFYALVTLTAIKLVLGFWFWELLLVRVKYNVKGRAARHGTHFIGYRPGL